MLEQSTKNDNLIALQQVSFSYGARKIIDNLSLTVPKGKITAIMGTSGCGKTTLLKLIGGQIKPQLGKILWQDGADIAQLNLKELYQLRCKMGMLFQFGALFTDLSVFDNVAFPLREHTQLSAAFLRDIVLMKLQAVGLRGARDLMPAEISGGMARRVALARAIALDPELIMYDEPFTGLDPISLGTSADLIKQLNVALGITSILVSHDLEKTFNIADQVILMSNGTVIEQGTPEQIKHSHNEWVKQFVNGNKNGPVHFHYPANEIVADFL